MKDLWLRIYVEQVDWKRKYEDVVDELRRVRVKRQAARKRVGELAEKLEEYESAATPPALSSKQTLSRHARKLAKQLQAYAASDRAKLMVAALHAASKGTGKGARRAAPAHPVRHGPRRRRVSVHRQRPRRR